MAKYIQKGQELRKYIDKLIEDYPELKNDPRLGWIVYFSVLAMPRIQGAVRKRFVQEAVGHLYDVKTVTKEVEYGHRKGETYEGLEIHKKKLFEV